MKHKELFKIYNKQDMKRNKFPLICIAVSLFLAMLVSLIIPQLQVGKQQYMAKISANMSKADLMVDVNFPSAAFDKKIEEYKAEGIKVEQITVSPNYVRYKGNQLMVYLFSGYSNLKKNEVIVSKSFADLHQLKVNDKIQLANMDKNNKVRISDIEQLPTEVTVNAEVAGYIKSNNLKPMLPSGESLLFLSGKNGETLKKELNKVENGYKYYTYQERQEQLYQNIDKEMGVLSLISSVGFIMAIAVLVSGIIMMIIKSKKDLAYLMLISIPKKDIIKAMKREVNFIIFIPLIASIILSVPVALIISRYEGAVIHLTGAFLLNTLKFIIFDVVLFLFYRNLALRYIKKLDPILIEKGEGGLKKLRVGEMICYLLPFPLTMAVYAALLQSGTSLSAFLYLAMAMIVTFVVLWIVVSFISILPLWKRWKASLYAFHSLRRNKLVFVVGTLNLAMLSCFILIGFNLGNTLNKSIDKGFAKNVPYHYMIKTSDTKDLEKTLHHSAGVDGYTKLHYLDTKVENDGIKDKSIRINEFPPNGTLNFRVVKGEDVYEGDKSQVLISEKYANAYHLDVGSQLKVLENQGIRDYTIKGIYDSGGVNVNWVLKESNGQYRDVMYLVDTKDGKALKGLKDCYIASVDSVGKHALSQADAFLKSFRILSILFILSAVIFNVNLVYMGQQLLRKDFAIMEALGIEGELVRQQMWLKSVVTVGASLLVSGLLYEGILNLMMQMVSEGSASPGGGVFGIVAGIAVLVVAVGVVVAKSTLRDCLEEIRE